MLPGRVSPLQMKRMMKQMGVSSEELEDVSEVIIRTATKQYLIKSPTVMIVTVQGQKTFQIVGEPEIMDLSAVPSAVPKETRTPEAPKPRFTDEDIELVVQQTNVSHEAARKALEEADGEVAEAIIKLMTKRK